MKRLLILASVCVLLQGCGISRFQPVLRDSTIVVRVDSVMAFDSVYIDRIRTVKEKADTVYVTDYKTEYKYRYRDRVKVDTLILTQKVTETQLVEKELTAWQRFRLKGFWWMLGIIGVLTLWKIAKIYLHL